LQTLVIIES